MRKLKQDASTEVKRVEVKVRDDNYIIDSYTFKTKLSDDKIKLKIIERYKDFDKFYTFYIQIL